MHLIVGLAEPSVPLSPAYPHRLRRSSPTLTSSVREKSQAIDRAPERRSERLDGKVRGVNPCPRSEPLSG
jgi:hypothetical protein